jgi:HAD superfamily hydrolase (TIGR01450 family)
MFIFEMDKRNAIRTRTFYREMIKAVVMDLDGTIYTGRILVPGAADVVRGLKILGLRVLYCTNNSTKTISEVRERLIDLGLDPGTEDVYGATREAGSVARDLNLKTVYCIGTKGLMQEIRSCGVGVSPDPKDADAVVVGLDTDLTYRRIVEFMEFRGREIPVIACNRDLFFPVEGGRLMPGCGVIVRMVEEVLGRSVDYVVGKPNTRLLARLGRDWNLEPQEVLVVGDSYESDIIMANQYGSPSLLLNRKECTAPPGTSSIRSLEDILPMFA